MKLRTNTIRTLAAIGLVTLSVKAQPDIHQAVKKMLVAGSSLGYLYTLAHCYKHKECLLNNKPCSQCQKKEQARIERTEKIKHLEKKLSNYSTSQYLKEKCLQLLSFKSSNYDKIKNKKQYLESIEFQEKLYDLINIPAYATLYTHDKVCQAGNTVVNSLLIKPGKALKEILNTSKALSPEDKAFVASLISGVIFYKLWRLQQNDEIETGT